MKTEVGAKMPLKTFLNLTEERQKEIINVCFDEFSQNDYESASLSRIVTNLGLAKGSFYRYFENKKDLYFYLADYAGKLVTSSFLKHLDGTGRDFYKSWMEYFLSLAEIEKEYPMVIRFRLKIASEKSSQVYQENRIENRSNRVDFIKEALLAYQEKGEIRSDIDIDFTSLFMLYFNFIMYDFITLKYNISKNTPVFSIPEETLRNETANFIKVIKEGLQSQSDSK